MSRVSLPHASRHAIAAVCLLMSVQFIAYPAPSVRGANSAQVAPPLAARQVDWCGDEGRLTAEGHLPCTAASRIPVTPTPVACSAGAVPLQDSGGTEASQRTVLEATAPLSPTVPASTPTPSTPTSTPPISPTRTTVSPTTPTLASGPPSWLPMSSMHTARAGLAAAVGPDGRIYALGGFDSQYLNEYPHTVEAYSPVTQAWTFVRAMPRARSYFGAATGPNGRIYTISGFNGDVGVAAAEAYTPATNQWAPVASPGPGDSGVALTRGLDGRLYLLAQVSSFGQGVTQGSSGAYAYDTTTHQWLQLPDLPLAVEDLAAATGPDGRIYAIGGDDPFSRYSTFASVETYNPCTTQWSNTPALPNPLTVLAAVTGPDGRIYAIGGSDVTGAATRSVEAYDPRTQRWTAVADLRVPRAALAAVRGADGRLYAIGGYNGPADYAAAPSLMDTVLSTVEAYGPIIQITPQRTMAGSTTVITGTNFAARATVLVTWGSTPGGPFVGTGQTDAAGRLLKAIRVTIPHGVRPGLYAVTAEDERSRYPVTAPVTVLPRQP